MVTTRSLSGHYHGAKLEPQIMCPKDRPKLWHNVSRNQSQIYCATRHLFFLHYFSTLKDCQTGVEGKHPRYLNKQSKRPRSR